MYRYIHFWANLRHLFLDGGSTLVSLFSMTKEAELLLELNLCRICLMIESTPPEGYEGNPRSQPTTLSGNGEVVQPDKTEANYCNATTSNKYSPNHTLSFQSTQPRTKLEARTGRRLNGCCCKSQSEFTLSQGKFTRAKEEVNSQTIFWLHLANLCWKQIAKEF